MAALDTRGVSAGSMSHRVKLQQLAAGQDAAGQPSQAWVDVATLWADVRFQNGLEAIKAEAPISVARASVRIRYRAGVTAAMRLLEGAVVYDIKAVLPDSTGRVFLDLAVETGANLG